MKKTSLLYVIIFYFVAFCGSSSVRAVDEVADISAYESNRWSHIEAVISDFMSAVAQFSNRYCGLGGYRSVEELCNTAGDSVIKVLLQNRQDSVACCKHLADYIENFRNEFEKESAFKLVRALCTGLKRTLQVCAVSVSTFFIMIFFIEGLMKATPLELQFVIFVGVYLASLCIPLLFYVITDVACMRTKRKLKKDLEKVGQSIMKLSKHFRDSQLKKMKI